MLCRLCSVRVLLTATNAHKIVSIEKWMKGDQWAQLAEFVSILERGDLPCKVLSWIMDNQYKSVPAHSRAMWKASVVCSLWHGNFQ